MLDATGMFIEQRVWRYHVFLLNVEFFSQQYRIIQICMDVANT